VKKFAIYSAEQRYFIVFNAASILSQVNPVYTLPTYLGVIRCNIILSTRCISIKWRLSVTCFYHEILLVVILTHSSLQAHSLSLGLSNNISRGAQNMKLVNMHFSLSSCFLFLSPIVLLITFSNSHYKH
jgi:hypothetical protein